MIYVCGMYSTLDLAKIEETGYETTDWHDSLKAYVEVELKK